jgi:hypothetical protein
LLHARRRRWRDGNDDDESGVQPGHGGAKRAAEQGPVYVTDRGRVSFVLLRFEDYERLSHGRATIADLLAGPPGVEDVAFEAPRHPAAPRPASFD